jgi:pyridoxamine 5'-phosphate oxidase
MPDSADPALAALLDGCWRALEAGAEGADHSFHVMVLATSGLNGRARARSVILRGVSQEERQVVFYSDARSPKIAELERDPRAALLFYNPAEGVQLRLEGFAGLLLDEEEEERAWRSASRYSRRVYLQSAPPGERAEAPTSGLPQEMGYGEPSEEALLPARENFRVLRFQLFKLDWLKLSRDGQRRALWSWDEEGRLESAWLMP